MCIYVYISCWHMICKHIYTYVFHRCTSTVISVCMFRRCTSTTACCGRSTSTASSRRVRTTAWCLEKQKNKHNSSGVGEFLRTGGVQTKRARWPPIRSRHPHEHWQRCRAPAAAEKMLPFCITHSTQNLQPMTTKKRSACHP